jgi:hypothetical protein
MFETLFREMLGHFAVVHHGSHVQLHVALLDALDCHCSEGCEVLGEADSDYNFG